MLLLINLRAHTHTHTHTHQDSSTSNDFTRQGINNNDSKNHCSAKGLKQASAQSSRVACGNWSTKTDQWMLLKRGDANLSNLASFLYKKSVLFTPTVASLQCKSSLLEKALTLVLRCSFRFWWRVAMVSHQPGYLSDQQISTNSKPYIAPELIMLIPFGSFNHPGLLFSPGADDHTMWLPLHLGAWPVPSSLCLRSTTSKSSRTLDTWPPHWEMLDPCPDLVVS